MTFRDDLLTIFNKHGQAAHTDEVLATEMMDSLTTALGATVAMICAGDRDAEMRLIQMMLDRLEHAVDVKTAEFLAVRQ